MIKILKKIVRMPINESIEYPGMESYEKARAIEEDKALMKIEAGMGKETADKVREMNRIGRQLRRTLGVK